MWLSTFDPFSELNRISDELARRAEPSAAGPSFRPVVDIHEADDAIELALDVPGVKREQLQIHVEKDVLTVTGERPLLHEDTKDGYHRLERQHGTFTRSFNLPQTVDTQAIDAELKDGVLRLKLPKRAELKPRKIEVSVTN